MSGCQTEVASRWDGRSSIGGPTRSWSWLTALDDPKAVEEASRAGFRGYLTKDTPISRFVSSIEAIVAGQMVFPHRLANTSRRSGSGDSAWLLISQLTPREREVLGLLVEGADGRTIADRLAISRNTVRTHVQSILTKLQVHSRLEAATLAVRHRVVPIPSTVGPDFVVERSVPRKSAADRSRITRST